MRLNCPSCGEQLSLNALIEHDSAREAIVLALQFPAPLGKLLMQYVSLFKPGQRALSMDRFASLLGELLPMVQAAQIERNGRTWPAPVPYWQQAIETMLSSRNKLTLPIKSHGYLLEIIAGFANKAEGKQEQKSEQGRKYGEIKQGPTVTPVKPAKSEPKGKGSMIPADIEQEMSKFLSRGRRQQKENPDGN